MNLKCEWSYGYATWVPEYLCTDKSEARISFYLEYLSHQHIYIVMKYDYKNQRLDINIHVKNIHWAAKSS